MRQTINSDGTFFFNNLPELVVGGFTPASGTGAGWIPVEYELDIFKGVGLAVGALSPAGELILDLSLKGWHRLRVAHNPAIQIWLDGDAGYTELPGNPSAIREAVMPAADFTGRKVHISPQRGAERSQHLTLFYLAAEPCSGPYAGKRNLIVTNDGHGVLARGIDTPRDIYRHVSSYQDSDVFRIVWGLYGGAMLSMNTNSKTAESPLRPEDGSYYTHDFIFNRSLRRLREAGADPLAVVRQATREYGLELHYYIRMSAFYAPFPHMNWTTRFFKEHPEFRCRDETGRLLNFISYAYPQVQEHLLKFYAELLEYDPEGICLAFNRGLPLMICEEPVLEAFRRKHGRNPKLPDEWNSPELQTVRHELLTDFIARAQNLLASKGKALSCIVPRDFDKARLYGLDPTPIARRGLVETLMIGAGHQDPPSLNADLEPVRALKAIASKTRVFSGGSNVKAHGCAWVNDDLPARARHMAAILDSGLDGGWFWDAEGVFGYEWEAMRRFGDRAALEKIMRGEWPSRADRETISIHDLVITRYNPWHAY